MARGVNKVILIGNLGQDPEVRYTPNGNAVTNLNLATDESYKDRQTGQLVPKTEWHRIVMFGKIAEVAGQYLKKRLESLHRRQAADSQVAGPGWSGPLHH